jgi:hypothetical protein
MRVGRPSASTRGAFNGQEAAVAPEDLTGRLRPEEAALPGRQRDWPGIFASSLLQALLNQLLRSRTRLLR